MTGTEKFRTERLVARSWQIEDLSFAIELWGDPEVTALIDSRGQLTGQQVEEKLHAEIDRERSNGVQYWALFNRSMAISWVVAAFGPGSIHPTSQVSS